MSVNRTKIANWLRSALILLEDADLEKDKNVLDDTLYCALDWLREVQINEKKILDNFKKECADKDRSDLNKINVINLRMQ